MNRFDFSRRALVASAATLAAAPAAVCAADLPAPALPPPPAGLSEAVPYKFDRAALTAILNRPYRHRQVLPATSFAIARDGMNLLRNSMQAYNDPMYFAEGPHALHAAEVFYHGTSVLLALDDTMFAKYPLADTIVKFAGAEKAGVDKGAQTNPGADVYRKLVADENASFFVCNNALSGMAANIAMQLQSAANPVTRAQVVAIHDEWVDHFLPGTFLVPAGVAAINAAQEARFTLLPA